MGQEAQMIVLGADRVMMLQMFNKLLEYPEILEFVANVKLPQTMVFSGEQAFPSFEGAAAILSGNLNQSQEAK